MTARHLVDDGWCRHRRCGNSELHHAGEDGGYGDECSPFRLSPGHCECREPARHGTLPDPTCAVCGGTGYVDRRSRKSRGGSSKSRGGSSKSTDAVVPRPGNTFTVYLYSDHLAALSRAVDAAVVHIDDARGYESRITFLERLDQIGRRAATASSRGGGSAHSFRFDRGEVWAIHQSIHVAAGRIEEFRGDWSRADAIRRLVEVRQFVRVAVWDHDGVPQSERG